MPSNEFTLAVNTGPLFAAAHAAKVAQVQCVKMTGTIYANALRTLTPPHGNGSTLKDTAKKKSKGILKLHKRIAEDIMGGTATPYGRPVLAKDGRWLAFDTEGRYTSGGGHFGFVVPTRDTFNGTRVPFVDPEQVLASSRWYKVRGSYRRYPAAPQGINFVRAGALKSAVAKRLKRAGFTISGWAPGARYFATGANIAKGFFEGLGGRGAAGSDDDLEAAFDDGFIVDETSLVEPSGGGWLSNDSFFTNAQLGRLSSTALRAVAGNALRKMEQNIIRSYKKAARALLS